MVRMAQQFIASEPTDSHEIVVGIGDPAVQIGGGQDVGIAGVIHLATGNRQIALHRRHSLLLWGKSAGRSTLGPMTDKTLIQSSILAIGHQPTETDGAVSLDGQQGALFVCSAQGGNTFGILPAGRSRTLVCALDPSVFAANHYFCVTVLIQLQPVSTWLKGLTYACPR